MSEVNIIELVDLNEQPAVSNPLEHVVSCDLNKNSMQNIGTKSRISKPDKKWLSNLSAMLYDEGWYTKSIYLSEMVNNAKDI